MKNLLKLGLLSVALAATTLANASNKVKVEVLASNELSISMSEVVEGEVLSISDKEGELIFSEVLKATTSYTKKIDFSQLKQGVYYVKATTPDDIKVTPFIIVPDQSKIVKGETKTYNTPVFNVKGGIAEVVINNEDKHDISISVYSEKSSIPLEESVVNTLVVNKTFNFKSLPIGDYKIVVFQGEYSYTEKIKL